MAAVYRFMPGADRDEETGEYVEKYPPEEFIAAINAGGGMASTQDVADWVGCAYETAYKKLRSLEEERQIESRKVANARLWVISDAE